MVGQGIWIGIAVGVFFAGIGIGFAVLQSNTSVTPMMMTSQQMQQMMNDPDLMNQWHQQMMNNPQAMLQMHDMMMSNPQHMNQMMGPMMDSMMNDPQMQQQMMTQMMGHQGMMNSMMNNQDMINSMMGDHMMGQGMMGQGMMMGPGMMQGSSSSSQSLPTGESVQTRTFEIFLDEVKIFAETESENGVEEIVEVELHLWNPSNIVVNKGDTVILKVSNPRGSIHSLAIPQFGVSTDNLEPRGGTETIEFVADKAGVFTFICNTPYVPEKNWCSADHAAMTGTIVVLE